MTILQTPNAVTRRDMAEIFPSSFHSNLRQSLTGHLAFDHSNLQFESQHDMKVIGGSSALTRISDGSTLLIAL